MKSKYIILSLLAITFMGFWLIGGSLMNSGIHPIGIIGIPLFIIQSFQDQGSSGICQGDCGPCWNFSPDHIVIDGQCKLPESVDDCNSIFPKEEWKFIDDRCTPIDGDNPIIGLDCPLTHTWNIESQRCDILWNSIYVVESIITVFFIIVISVIVIVYYWRKSKRK